MSQVKPLEEGPMATEPGNPAAPPAGRSESLRLIGGLIAVVAGLAVLLVIAVVAMREVHANSESIVSIATAAFGVVGSVVGAYFGVKVGSDGTQKAIAGMQGEAAKAQAFAAHLDPSQAAAAIQTAERLRSDVSHERPGVV
jgi:hypothetical protein